MLRVAFVERWRGREVNRLQVGAILALVCAWIVLYRPVLRYLTTIFTREDFRTNQLLLLGVLVLVGLQLRRGDLRMRLDAAPQLRWPPLVLALGGSMGFLLAERFLDVNTLSAALFGLATYGLLGLWVEPVRWRKGLPVALLLIGVLPFGDHMQTFVGYPMRIATASIVRDGLAAAGVHTVGVDTILVFENGISQVDVPCSGVKSLWTGILFLLAATWIQRKPLNARWLLVAAFFAGVLFLVNLARVAVLVAVGQVAGLTVVAQMLHVPLGVLGFAAACAVAAFLLNRLANQPVDRHPNQGNSASLQTHSRPGWLTPTLIAAIGLMAAIYTPRPSIAASAVPVTWRFPAALATEPLPLTPKEQDWLTRDGAESAARWQFNWRGLKGSMILVTSRTWRAHHRPERCFEVYGLSLNDSRTHLVEADFPLRFVSLGDGHETTLLSASYWFQSAERTTDDYGTRIWSDLSPQRERWVLASILFDGVVDPNTQDVAALYETLHEAVAASFRWQGDKVTR
jgi:exosortase O